MEYKFLILFCVQLIISIDLSSGILPIFITRATPPPITYPSLVSCPQFSTATDKWVTYTYQGVASRYCYLYPTFNTYASSWHEAYDNCRKKNATLLSIQNSIINRILSFPLKPGQSYTGYFWIGLNSLNGKRGEYKWSDGSPRPYTNFANTTSNGAPLPTDLRDQGRCVSIRVIPQNYIFINQYRQSIGFWFKDDCNLNHQYICQKSYGLVPTLPPLPTGGCPTGWYNANQKCIKYFSQPQTFDQARKNCESYLSGEVLTIQSQQEQDFVTVMTAGLQTPYIGFVRKFAYSAWSWTDQSRITFTNFGVQMTPFVYYTQKNCVIVVTNSTQPGKWMGVSCNETHPVICQVNKNPVDSSGTNLLNKKCNISGFGNFIQYRNSCYSVLDSDPNKFLNFSAAEKTCQSMSGSSLLSIVDNFEETFLRYYLSQNGKTDKYWIGFRSLVSGLTGTNISQVFQWTNGWPVYYTNWDKGEPLFPGLPQEECVYISKSNGTWRTTTCDSNFAFICKITTNPFPKLDTDTSGVCPQINGLSDKSLAWVDVDKRSKYCYWFSADRKGPMDSGFQTWSDSSFHCRRRNGTLVSIHSNHELMLLSPKITQVGTQAGTSYNTWIGLSKDPNGKFVWEDRSALSYTNWDPDEKIVSKVNDLNDDTGHTCVEVKSLDLMWRQQPCSGNKHNYFICAAKKIYKNKTNRPKGSTQSPKNIGKQNSDKSTTGLSSGAKAGIAFGVIGGVIIVGVIAYFGYKRYNAPIGRY